MSDNAPKMLTPRETEIAVLAWRALDETKVDYEKMVALTGLKNVASARVTWNTIRKKILKDNYVSSTFGTTPVKKRPAADLTPKKKEGDDSDNPTPTKKRGSSSAKKSAAAAAASPGSDTAAPAAGSIKMELLKMKLKKVKQEEDEAEEEDEEEEAKVEVKIEKIKKLAIKKEAKAASDDTEDELI